MKVTLQKSSGICLIVGTAITVLTMVLHPSGGNNEHILKMQHVLITSHAIVIFSLPFLFFGFFGLSSLLTNPSKIALLGLTMMGFGLVAAMLAASLNGIVLPLFVSAHPTGETVNVVRSYGMAFSKPMSYILIAMSSQAIFIWSLLMINQRGVAKWLGYYGIVILALTALAYLLGFNLTNLLAFRFFIFAIVAWIFTCGLLMVKGNLVK